MNDQKNLQLEMWRKGEEMLFLRLGFGFLNKIVIITAIRNIQVTSPIYTTWLYNAIDVDALLLFLIGV